MHPLENTQKLDTNLGDDLTPQLKVEGVLLLGDAIGSAGIKYVNYQPRGVADTTHSPALALKEISVGLISKLYLSWTSGALIVK